MARSPSAGPDRRESPDGEGGRRWLRKLFSGIVGVAALVGFSWLLQFAYSEGRFRAGGGDTAVIAADAGPFKVKPESPGGRAIPDRDKRIYDRIQAAPTGEPVERLLPLPEAPVSPADLRAAAVEPPLQMATPDDSERPPAAKNPAKPGKQAAKAAAPPPKPAVERKYRLQLAALRSRAAADKAWKRLRNRHRKLLSGLDRAIERKDLGPSKGVFYRLLVGPVKDHKTARRLCADLAKRKVGCLVVPR